MLKHYYLIVFTVSSLTGCATSSSGRAPDLPHLPVPQGHKDEVTENPSSRTVLIIPTGQSQAYHSLVATSIQQLSTTDPRKDSLTLDVQYRISLNRDSEVVTASGIIEEFMVKTGNRLESVTALVGFPVSFIGSITTHKLQFESSDLKDQKFSSVRCETPSQIALATIQRNLFVSPLKIKIGMVWTDSLSYTICNGEVPINLICVRTYIATGALFYKGDQVIVIDRTEKTLSTGEGSQDQHRISIRGNGTGTAHIYIDRSNGLLLALNGENKTDLLIQSSGRVQQFLQTSRETIVQR